MTSHSEATPRVLPDPDHGPPDEPWQALGFRYYVQDNGSMLGHAPLVVLGGEVTRDDANAPRVTQGWHGNVLQPFGWTGRDLLRIAHQCAGDACEQRYVIGRVMLRPSGLYTTLGRLMRVGFNDPRELKLSEVRWLSDVFDRAGLSCDLSFRRSVQSFYVADLPTDGHAASRILRPLVIDALPDDLHDLFRELGQSVQVPLNLYFLTPNGD